MARAYAACEALARSHYENFPVASRLLPAPMRPHVAAVYAFARVADDIADEGSARPAERREQLRLWQDRIHRAAAVEDAGQADDRAAPDRDALIALAIGHSIRSLDLPLQLFDDLLSAFAQDTMTTRYASWDEVFDYCRRSANPIGRLVLRIGGYRDEVLDRSSDALCTALQLTNFWQDFGRDWRAGRLYVPRDEQIACGAIDTELESGRISPAWNRVLARAVQVTRETFEPAGTCATAWRAASGCNCVSPGSAAPACWSVSIVSATACSRFGRRSAQATRRCSCGARPSGKCREGREGRR